MLILKKNLKTIDPTQMSTEQGFVLEQFLIKNSLSKKVFLTNTNYSITLPELDNPNKMIDYQFQLSNVIISRQHTKTLPKAWIKDKTQLQFDVIEKKELGTDKPGALYFCKGTLIPLEDGKLFFKKRINLYLEEEEPVTKQVKTKAKKQNEKKATIRSNVHIPTIFHFLKGKELFEIIDNDLSAKKAQDVLSTEQRLQLSINLLRALKEQIHDNNIIHRDIKPENILVDIETMKVNIIDFGLSKIINTKVLSENVGDRDFVPPEQLRNETSSEESDLYSMGIIISLLWKILPNDNIEAIYNGQIQFDSSRFNEIDDLPGYDKTLTLEAIKLMTNMNLEERNSEIDYIKFFEAIQFNRKYNDITDENLIDHLKLAHMTALETRDELNRLSKSSQKDNDSSTTFDKISEILKSALNILEITDNKLVHQEYVTTIGINVFQNLKSKQEIFDKLHQIEEEFYEKITKLLNISEQLKRMSTLNLSNDVKFFFEILMGEYLFYRDSFLHLAHEIDTTLEHINSKLRYMSIDDIVAFNEHASSQIERITKILPSHYEPIIGAPEANIAKITLPNVIYELLSNGKKSDAEFEIEELKQNKNYLKTAIASYLCSEALKLRKKLDTSSSLKDIYDILLIINQAKTSNQLIENVKERLSHIKWSFWSRNELVTYLNAALNRCIQYKEPAREKSAVS